jgi:hypothetical protein
MAVVWPRCAGRFEATTKENQMTDQLALALKRDPVAKRFLIVPQLKLIDENLRADVVTKGIIDIAAFFNWNSETYLAFECKRLNVHFEGGRHSLAGKYAEEGLMRYVSAQYARALPLGAMLGYVMDSDMEWALERLAAALESRRAQLGVDNPLEDLPAVGFFRCFRTFHRRSGEVALFEVRHALLPLRPETPANT